MKELRKIYLVAFAGYWASYSGFIILIRALRGKDLQASETLILGFIIAAMYVGGTFAGLSKSIKPKIIYLESDDPYEPKFGDRKEIKLEDESLSFDQLKNRIDENWIITHIDLNNKIIKFRTKFGFFNWGLGGYLEYLPGKKCIQFISFPLEINRKIEKVNRPSAVRN